MSGEVVRYYMRWNPINGVPYMAEADGTPATLYVLATEYDAAMLAAAPAQGASLRHTNVHLTKESVERNVRSSSALEGISTKTFQAASTGDEE